MMIIWLLTPLTAKEVRDVSWFFPKFHSYKGGGNYDLNPDLFNNQICNLSTILSWLFIILYQIMYGKLEAYVWQTESSQYAFISFPPENVSGMNEWH